MPAHIKEYKSPLDEQLIEQEICEQGQRIARRAAFVMYKDVAKEVIDGKWGDGMERIEKLEEAGYDSAKVQNIVNVMIMEGAK